jgi:hypothetical protein
MLSLMIFFAIPVNLSLNNIGIKNKANNIRAIKLPRDIPKILKTFFIAVYFNYFKQKPEQRYNNYIFSVNILSNNFVGITQSQVIYTNT